MDADTLHAYEHHAKDFAEDWLAQPAPDDMYALLRHYFTPGPTADIGCGAGRDVAWLNANGFDTLGADASPELLREARLRYPQFQFVHAALPALEGIAAQQFQNVLCETVIMHLDAVLIGPSVRRLLDVLRPGGTLFVSWRVTEGLSQRDKFQRLYSSFDDALVLDECSGHAVLLDSLDVNQSSGKAVRRVVVRKA